MDRREFVQNYILALMSHMSGIDAEKRLAEANALFDLIEEKTKETK